MSARTFRFPTVTLDVERSSLVRDGDRVPLSPKDFALLLYLVTHAGRLIPHAELLHAVWGDTFVTPEVLKVRIGRLRRLLGDAADRPRFIQNVHGEGYRFIARPKAPAPSDPLSRPDPLVVGRHSELQRLGHALSRVAAADRQVVLISGEAGIGKTTLIDAFVADAVPRDPGPPVWVGRGDCVEQYGSGEPYMPVLEAIGRLARSDTTRRFTILLRQYAPSWLLQLPALLDGTERERLQRELPGPNRERMVRELSEALEAVTTATSGSPALLILILEDLQWADASTLDLLSVLARRKDPARLMVLGSYRPCDVAAADQRLRSLLQDLRARQRVVDVPLPPLTELHIAAYLSSRFPGNDFSVPLARVILRLTAGNPLFVTDVVRDLVAREMLVASPTGWTFGGNMEAVSGIMPQSIRHLVARQWDKLDDGDRRLLEAASVAGIEFSAAVVSAALMQPIPDSEDRCLDLASREQFVRVSGDETWPDGTHSMRFAFQHALYRDLCRERVGGSRLREWRLRIAKRKEAAFGARAPEIAAELADHFEGARVPLDAARYREQAAQNAVQRAAYDEARNHLEHALRLIADLPEATERRRQELSLRTRLGSLLALTGAMGGEGAMREFTRARDICHWARFPRFSRR
jgi:predicted ATPase/DNA-binding winged helix-turn-helix (wHTH) protein